MAQAQRPSTIHRPGGPIINLVGTTSFEAIMFMKEGQTYCAAHIFTKMFHMQIFFYENSTFEKLFFCKGWRGHIPTVPICSDRPDT